MPGAGFALSTEQIVQLLDRDFGGALDRAALYAAVRRARSDLSGSISAEALDEMTYRLAEHRLAARLAEPAAELVGADRH
jgi:hypothetical protein